MRLPLLAGLLLLGAFSSASVQDAPPRTALPLNDGWRFLRADLFQAHTPAFVDSSWDSVNLPHTWNALDGQDGGDDYYRGPGWYRKCVAVPASMSGQSLFLTFDGASLSAQVYVNGSLVGEHKGGFSAFTVDVTSTLAPGLDNLIAVRVSNALDYSVAPLSGDFTRFGGLHRGARLTAVHPFHVSLTDHSSPGVYLRQTSLTPTSASVQVTTRLRNDCVLAQTGAVEVEILDAGGARVALREDPVLLAASAGGDVVQSLTFANPRLWDGRADPYLYRAVVRLKQGGVARDEVRQPLGLRSFQVDPARGFLLNGRRLDLHGAAFHQDRLDKGWAISDADRVEDVGLLKEIGATFARPAHYQHAQKTYDLLDEAGIVAWTEVPLVDTIFRSEAFTANVKQQLRELIRQNYNHPSIVAWGLHNEVHDGSDGAGAALVRELHELAKAEDPTRRTTGAIERGLEAEEAIYGIPDLAGFNLYFGWYYGSYDEIGPWLDAYHASHPKRPVGLSEYGAGASIRQHQENPSRPASTGLSPHPEEYQNLVHEAHWSQLASRDFVWCKTVWNLFDFASDHRHEGDTHGRNDKGLVTYDRRTRKDAFFFYKAQWNPEPMVYIASRRFTPRPVAAPVEVKAYSNLEKLELILNGETRGPQTGTGRVFKWTGIPLIAGSNTIQVRDALGSQLMDTVTWVGAN